MTNWIKCSERLPKKGDIVLVWMVDTYWFSELDGDDFMIYADGGSWKVADNKDVTHWMPLPAPPEEK